MSLQYICQDCWLVVGTAHDCVLDSLRMRRTPEGKAELERRRAATYAKAAGKQLATRLEDGLHHAQKHGVPYSALRALRAGPRDCTCLAAARKFIADAECRYLLLLGPTGRGKTVAAALVATDFCARWPWNNQPSGNAHAPLYFLEARDLTHATAFDAEQARRMQELKDCRLLVLDDAGDEGTDFGRGQLADLLNHRGDNNRRTVVTANLTREEFKKRYGDATARRIRQWGDVPDLSKEPNQGDRP